jgi:hypothetical protein
MESDRRLPRLRVQTARRPVGLVVSLLVVAASMGLSAGPAAAALGVSAETNFPDSVSPGQTGLSASITITNTSTGADRKSVV